MITYSGSRTLQSFAPGWTDPEVLEKTLVGRLEIVNELERLAVDGAGGANKHQRLIVGVRGSGKTHILRVLHHRLRKREELHKKLLIVYLLEDELGVATFLDFVVRMLRAVAHWYPELSALDDRLDHLYDLPSHDQERYAVSLLLEAAGDRDILILMENLAVTFDDVRGFGRQGQETFRDLVQHEHRVMVFATSQALTEVIRSKDAPFHGFFKIIPLTKLSEGDAIYFLRAAAIAMGRDKQVEFLNTERGIGQMRAIYGFTGGNHRLLVTFFEFLCANSISQLSQKFLDALNELKAYYQEQMRSLSSQQQKIVQYLSLEQTPQTVKEIARGTLAGQNTVSKQLGDLKRLGFVSAIPQGRETYYEVTETLFRICHQADLARSGAPVQLFVDFLGSLYTAEELALRYLGYGLLSAYMGPSCPASLGNEAPFYREALMQYHQAKVAEPDSSPEPVPEDAVRSFFRLLASKSAYREVVQFAGQLGEKASLEILHHAVHAQLELGDIEKAGAAARKVLDRNPDDTLAHLIVGTALANSEQFEDAEAHLRRAISPDNAPMVNASILEGLGALSGYTRRYAEALEWFRKLNEVRPDYARGWKLTAKALVSLGIKGEAESAYRKVLELDPNEASVLEDLGWLMDSAGRYAEALELFRKLNAVRPDYARGWAYTALETQTVSTGEAAESLYRKAIELDSTEVFALWNLGWLFNNTGRHAEALELFLKVTEVQPDYANGWAEAALALDSLGRRQEAEALYRKALELDPREALVLQRLGGLLGDAGRHAEALELFLKLNEVQPAYARGWALAAVALDNLSRNHEAEASYRKALELDPADVLALENLGLLVGKAGRFAEAFELFQKLNEAVPDYAHGWTLAAWAKHNQGGGLESERLYRKALELDRKDVFALIQIALFADERGNDEESEDLFRQALEFGADPAAVYSNRGETRRKRGEFERALADYREAQTVDPSAILPRFNAVSALLGLGKIEESLAKLKAALDVYTRVDEASRQPLRLNLCENLESLFRHAPTSLFAEFLSGAVEIIRRHEQLGELESAVPATVFALLRGSEGISDERFEAIVEALETALAPHFDLSVAVMFLRTGIEYRRAEEKKKGSGRKVLLRLRREERALFCQQLGIEDPGK